VARSNEESDVIYRLLGELEIGRDDEFLGLPSGPTLIILAVLLLNVNRQLTKAQLIRAAWGDHGAQEAQLHKRISAVRELLAQVGRSADLKTYSGFGYEIRAADDEVDMRRFQRLLSDAAKARTQRHIEDEIGYLRQAQRLWRGQHALSNVPGGAFHAEVTALEQRRKRAAARLFDLELARGNHENVLDELISVASFYPSDRRLCEQLMLARYRCGHVSDAIATYENYRAVLAEETGGEPDALLRNLYFAIARGDEAAVAAAESAVARRTGISHQFTVAVPRQLPRPVDLFGRDDLAAELSWLLRRHPRPAFGVVVISGPGGIGKTALAVRAAHESAGRYRDGQLYLELGGTTGERVDTSEALAQFLRAFGMPHVPDTKAERLGAYRTLLAGRRVLLVLDDAADGAQVEELMPGNPGCAVVVTARQRLPEISGGHHVAPLEPLGRADATEMFLRVVSDAGIDLDNDLDAVGRVVALCGGLPLALRIAGALRAHDHPQPTAALADRLASQGPARRAHAGLYGGDFEVVHSDAPGWQAPPEVLADVDAAPLEWFEKERLNIRAAVTHCAELGLTSICWDLAVSAHEFYTIGGHFDDWLATHTIALTACRAAGDRRGEGIVLACLNQPAFVASRRASGETTLADLRRAADLLAERGDRHGQAIALRTLGNALRRNGHITRPLALFDEALAHYTASGDTVGQWQTLRFTGQTVLDLGRHEQARDALEQALQIARRLGNQRLIAQSQYWCGQAMLATGDLGGAQAAFGAVLAIYRDGTSVGHAYAAHGLGDVACLRGAYGAAERHFAVAGDLARDGADLVLEGRVWLSVAGLHRAQGQVGEQATALQQAADVFAWCGAAYLEAQALAALAGVLAGRGDTEAARAAWDWVESLWDGAGLPLEDRIHPCPGV
jgi:DNA-binding SARP family transcriptional activator/tetratricopeptide (TPR) repeat protein